MQSEHRDFGFDDTIDDAFPRVRSSLLIGVESRPPREENNFILITFSLTLYGFVYNSLIWRDNIYIRQSTLIFGTLHLVNTLSC